MVDEYIKGLKNYIDESANIIQGKVCDIVQIDDIYDLNKLKPKKYRNRNNVKQPSLVTSGEISEAEMQLQQLEQQNRLLNEKMKELEQQRSNLRFELQKYRQEIEKKRKLLNKEVREGFQLLSLAPRLRSLSERSRSKSPKLFLTQTSSQSTLKKLTQLHILMRDVLKTERAPPLIRSNKRYTYEQFMHLNRSEYFSYIHNRLPSIKQYFLELSYKRINDLKSRN